MGPLLYFLHKYHSRIEEHLRGQVDKKSSPITPISTPTSGSGNGGSLAGSPVASLLSSMVGTTVERKGLAWEEVQSVLERLDKVLVASYPVVKEISPGKGNASGSRRDRPPTHKRKHSQQFTRSMFSAEELRESGAGLLPLLPGVHSSAATDSIPLTARAFRQGSAIFSKTLSPLPPTLRPTYSDAESITKVM